jgi:hypothetical protein
VLFKARTGRTMPRINPACIFSFEIGFKRSIRYWREIQRLVQHHRHKLGQDAFCRTS